MPPADLLDENGVNGLEQEEPAQEEVTETYTSIHAGPVIDAAVSDIPKIKTDITVAQTTANTAMGKGDAAQSTANTALADAATAQARADVAYNNAATAQTTAETAWNAADTAQITAGNALTKANQAQTEVDAAEVRITALEQSGGSGGGSSADEAMEAALAAQATADDALAKANQAQTEVDAAEVRLTATEGVANTALNNANLANTTAETAWTAAEQAQTEVDAAEVRLTATEGVANTAKTTADTALANAATAQAKADTAFNNAATAQAEVDAAEVRITAIEQGSATWLERLTANRTYYVAATGGNDNNDGLSTGTPFATINKAAQLVSSKLHVPEGIRVTIRLMDGVHTVATSIYLWPYSGAGEVYIYGNETTPLNTVVRFTNQTGADGEIIWYCFVARRPFCFWRVGYCKVEKTNANVAAAISAIEGGRISARQLYIGTMDVCCYANEGGTVDLIDNGTIFILAGGRAALTAATYGKILYGTFDLRQAPPTPTFSIAFAHIRRHGFIINSTAALGNCSGKKHVIESLGLYDSRGVGTGILPGDQAGTVTGGGQFV